MRRPGIYSCSLVKIIVKEVCVHKLFLKEIYTSVHTQLLEMPKQEILSVSDR